MWPSVWFPVESEFLPLMDRCQGLIGQPWAYSTSHGQFLVRFYREGSESGIYLYCKDCDALRFDSSWREARPTLHFVQGPTGHRIEIQDGERLKVSCGSAFLAESADYLHLPEPKM